MTDKAQEKINREHQRQTLLTDVMQTANLVVGHAVVYTNPADSRNVLIKEDSEDWRRFVESVAAFNAWKEAGRG